MGSRPSFQLLLLSMVLVLQFRSSVVLARQEECGRSFRRSRQPRAGSIGRIINGKQSVKGAWPWQVEYSIHLTTAADDYQWKRSDKKEIYTMEVQNTSKINKQKVIKVSLQLLHPQFGFLGHWCGGVLVSREWLLTAAHCINNDLFNLPLAALWTAVLGDWDREMEELTEERIPVEKIVLHERFHNFQHDIALMKLSRPVKFTTKTRIRAVCLPSKRLTHNQTDFCVATGWGRDIEDGLLAGKLLESKVPVHDNAICKKKYGHAVSIRSGHLCAGHLDGATGTCVGDSGGPLQCAMDDGRWILAGITSFGSGCAKPGFPDVYTRLSFYLPWIKAKMKSNRSDLRRYG